MSTFKLKGKRVLLNKPETNDLGLELSPETKEQLMQEEMKKYTHLEVFSVGDEVSDYKTGDVVYVSPSVLAYAEILHIDGADRIMVRDMDISIIWS
jgi:hypothetical protein